MNIFKFILNLFIFTSLILGQQKSLNNQQCDQSCSSCSQDQISECLSCKANYFYLNEQYQCLNKCPQGTYLDSNLNQCLQCASQFCSLCSSTQCLQCSDGYSLDPNNSQNCISKCGQEGQIQDEQGQCGYSCKQSQIYNIEYSSFSCQKKILCPQTQVTPQAQIQNSIASYLIDSTMTTLTLIDIQGNVVLYSYPFLQVEKQYTLNITTYEVFPIFFTKLKNHLLKKQVELKKSYFFYNEILLLNI
ncbi:serine protease (macronuclear) [Tetrahymena thermophila SB210]|uniref:Serine protease n=1 Tax=Tetrahymena thermophila (strain SB210) TaxID=312017 RepID=I7MLK8_TETTS|nr:serine protease [Tetrahymena thermophila SB210]EAS02613.2 serine protease [Tetrahymena thermophila SB210]|eukprot:XP_001022858.2 serine protease [Tetrahymena thermophila SB210]